MTKSIFIKLTSLIVIWRVALFLVAFMATFFINISNDRFPYSDTVLRPTELPIWIQGFGNFDGVHYILMSQSGYNSAYYQAFFPLYPMTINIVQKVLILNKDQRAFLAGIIVSNLCLILFVYLFYKLIKLDYSRRTTLNAILLLLVYPTAYYLGSIYTESLFLFLTGISLFLIRKNKFLLASFFVALATATRVIGVMLYIVFIYELIIYLKEKHVNFLSGRGFLNLYPILIAPAGLLLYCIFLWINFKNPLAFISAQPGFGASRSSVPIVLFPQVLFRYAKILLTINANSMAFFIAVLELGVTIISVIILYLSYKKVRMSYWLFTFGCLIIPTLTGTLSSMPRYSLMLFLIFPFLVNYLGSKFRYIVIILILLQVILVSLFTRGYWVA